MVVAYTDNVLTARAFAARNGYRIDANQELLALGGANLAAGFTRTFPVSSSGSRTVVGDALGSRSQLHSLVAVLLVVVTLSPPSRMLVVGSSLWLVVFENEIEVLKIPRAFSMDQRL